MVISGAAVRMQLKDEHYSTYQLLDQNAVIGAFLVRISLCTFVNISAICVTPHSILEYRKCGGSFTQNNFVKKFVSTFGFQSYILLPMYFYFYHEWLVPIPPVVKYVQIHSATNRSH